MKDYYDLSKAVYNKNEKICVICHKKDEDGNEHGEFWITPSNLKYGYGCPKCKKERLSELKRKTTEQFIEDAKKVHGDKYDYSKVVYTKSGEQVCIICPIHGEFWVIANSHLRGSGCPKCSGYKRLNTKIFVKRAKEIHGEKYDYSKVVYSNNRKKVTIICPVHGEFQMSPKNHLKGQTCPKCAAKERAKNLVLKIDKFIEKAKAKHGDKYDYSKVEYTNNMDKIKIICPIHGEFLQRVSDHLHGCGCPKCGGKTKITNDEYIKRAKEKHGNKYDYSKTKYISSEQKITIICPIHGEFKQLPYDHLSGSGCQRCGIENRTKLKTHSKEQFINKAKQIHGDKYDYSKVEYNRSDEKVCIICPIHGEFWQFANDHLRGSNCPKCKHRISIPEEEIIEHINTIQPNIEIIKRNRTILRGKEIDIYFPEYKIGIEYDGLIWHSTKYKEDKYYHLNKTKQCEEQGIRLIHIFEDEWLYKKEIVKSIISELFNKQDRIIPSENCIVKTLDNKTAEEFFNENNIDGYFDSDINIGLFFNDELVSAIGISINNDTVQINRYCNKLNTKLDKSLNSFIKHIANQFKISKFVVNIDKRYNNSKPFKDVGFNHTTNTEPKSYYIVQDRRYDKSEKLVSKYQIHEIYDCGNSIYELNIINNIKTQISE